MYTCASLIYTAVVEPLRVLTIDDEEGMRAAIKRSLNNFAASVPGVEEDVRISLLEADSAETGFEIIKRDVPHIVLLDQKLPGKSGIELMEELSAQEESPLIVMITAYATIETAVQATKRGAYDFLPKPFTPEELRSTLRKAAEHVVVSIQARRLEAERKQIRFQFISVLAHELKAPLNAVQGYIDVLEDQYGNLEPSDREMVFHRCGFRLKYMRKMIDDLLDLTRIESGQKRRELREINLHDIAASAIETCLPDAIERGISVSLHSAEETTMQGDADEIEIIFNNLVSNAVKYNRKNGTVDVYVVESDDAIEIRVTDTGIGMTQEECDRLFEDFVRIKNEKTRSIPGSGLGLSIVKKIAELYRGRAAVSSEPDKGTTFTISLLKSNLESTI